jgi:outer membrane receptor protein involved in Fe transport
MADSFAGKYQAVKLITYLVLSLILISTAAFSQTQGRISGKVINDKNEAVSGATITVKGVAKGTNTGVDGNFVLVLPAGKYEITIKALGYAVKVIGDVEVTQNGVTDLNVVVESSSKDLDNVTVESRSSGRRETVNTAIAFQRNTNTVASVVSAEAIRRSPDRNTGEVLKRTPGASVQEGRFLIVRGLADRYNQAMLNGVLLTSTEPDRKTFSFDLIPASMIDNLVINKAFVPEYPGEWAGGLIQVNTKDIPAKGFLNVQIGTGFNTQSTGRTFYRDAQSGKYDWWLGIEDGTRALPAGYTTKSGFDTFNNPSKIAIGKQLRNSWSPKGTTALPNVSLQANAGFNTKFLGKNVGGIFGIIYSRNNRILEQTNSSNALSGGVFTRNFELEDDRYVQDITWGALGSLSMQFNPKHKVSIRSLINVNAPNAVVQRTGFDFTRDEFIRGTELTFKQNTFNSTQLTGDHKLCNKLSFKWYGSFNILDGYIPDQRRIQYTRQNVAGAPYLLLISNTLAQNSGSRIFQDLSDYIYTAGGDLTYNYNMFGLKQAIKGGYMLQIKDRLYDAKLFANYLPRDNAALRQLTADQVFNQSNFGNGEANSTLFAFDAIKGSSFRYMANTILNAGFLQFDNQFTRNLRVVWGLRVEDYDQLVGSVKKWDPRHTHVVVRDYLPGLNLTYKLNKNNNLRVSASQTVIRPELRELAFLNLYDFELNASVQGKPSLERTKVTNLDARYEIYPQAGEMFTFGVFYKNFEKPIEQVFNEGIGGASTFSFQNATKARAYGVELEFRKKLDFINFRNFTIQGNASYINSRVEDDKLNIDRKLQGQSPYLLNLGLMYDLPKKGFSATLLFNQAGERIYLVGDLSGGAGSPDIYEAPRPVLDLQLTKKAFKDRGEFRLNVQDILNQRQYFYQNADTKFTFQKNSDAYRFTRRFGTTVNITFNYAFIR